MKKTRKPNKWLAFSSLVFQIAIIMWASVNLGKFLDKELNSSGNFYILLLCIIGLIITIWTIYQQSKNL